MNTVENVKDVVNIGRNILVATCTECGERVVMGRFVDHFQHEVVLERTYHESGTVASQRSKMIDYCPKA
jgi:hypothetical protein